MESTRRLEIELPETLADGVQARVESGEFADASEVVAVGLALLVDRDGEEEEEDPELEAWLRGEVVPAYEKWKSGGEKGLTADEVRASLARRRSRRDHEVAE